MVTKASGTKVPFSAEKIRQSLKKSGATQEMIEEILDEMYQQIYSDMPTHRIYRIAYDLLKKRSRPAAGRYQLKQAIFDLGPSGFPFEQYVAALFRQDGFSAITNELLEGYCVKHEVDVVAAKNVATYIIECKYHQQRGTICDVKIPLYVVSRFKDIEQQWKLSHEPSAGQCEPWLITNTRFSTDAIKYALCMGLHLLSWDFPTGKGLKDIIDKAGLYPVTCLTTLSRHEKQKLLERAVVLCKTLVEHPVSLEVAGLSPARSALVMAEAQHLCKEIINPGRVRNTTLIN